MESLKRTKYKNAHTNIRRMLRSHSEYYYLVDILEINGEATMYYVPYTYMPSGDYSIRPFARWRHQVMSLDYSLMLPIILTALSLHMANIIIYTLTN